MEATKRAIVGGTTEFLGQLIALLLVAQWLERWLPDWWPRFDSWHASFRVNYYNGDTDHAAAIYYVFVYYTIMSSNDQLFLLQDLCIVQHWHYYAIHWLLYL